MVVVSVGQSSVLMIAIIGSVVHPEAATGAGAAVVAPAAADAGVVVPAHPSGDLGERRVGKAGGVDPRTEAPDLPRVLVTVDEGLAVVRGLDVAAVGTAAAFVVVVEAGRELQGRGALVVEISDVVGEPARAVLVLAFGPVIRRKRERVKGRNRGG